MEILLLGALVAFVLAQRRAPSVAPVLPAENPGVTGGLQTTLDELKKITPLAIAAVKASGLAASAAGIGAPVGAVAPIADLGTLTTVPELAAAPAVSSVLAPVAAESAATVGIDSATLAALPEVADTSLAASGAIVTDVTVDVVAPIAADTVATVGVDAATLAALPEAITVAPEAVSAGLEAVAALPAAGEAVLPSIALTPESGLFFAPEAISVDVSGSVAGGGGSAAGLGALASIGLVSVFAAPLIFAIYSWAHEPVIDDALVGTHSQAQLDEQNRQIQISQDQQDFWNSQNVATQPTDVDF